MTIPTIADAEVNAVGDANNVALYQAPYNGELNIPCLSREQKRAAAIAAIAALTAAAQAREIANEQPDRRGDIDPAVHNNQRHQLAEERENALYHRTIEECAKVADKEAAYQNRQHVNGPDRHEYGVIIANRIARFIRTQPRKEVMPSGPGLYREQIETPATTGPSVALPAPAADEAQGRATWERERTRFEAALTDHPRPFLVYDHDGIWADIIDAEGNTVVSNIATEVAVAWTREANNIDSMKKQRD